VFGGDGGHGVAVPAVVYQIVRGDSVRYPAAGRIQQRRRRDAMATVDKLGGNWIIVRSHDTVARDEIGGASESEANAPSSNREFWTGDGWAGQYGLARYFATKEEAEAYLARHWHEME
jgi:hypothetical protein